MTAKKILLTTAYAPYDTVWGESLLDVLRSRLGRGHDLVDLRSEMPTWALYLLAENVRTPCTVMEYPHWDDFMRELDRGYDLVGIQLKSIHTARVARMVEAIRRHHPRTEVLLGGYGVAALDDKMPGDTRGLAEYLKQAAHHMCRDEGVRYLRRLCGERDPERPITQYHLPYARYHVPGMRSFQVQMPAVLVALGCPSACEFCNTSAFYKHQKIYVSEPEETFRFLRHHRDELGLDSVLAMLFDEDIFLNPEYVRELGRLLRGDKNMWGVRYSCFGSVKALSAFEPEELRACGVGNIWIGVESGMVEGERSKTGYAKRDGAKSPPQLFEALRRVGIETTGSMILGFDFHTPENIVEDIDYFVKLKPTFYQIGPLTPCPGTKLFRRLQAEGRLLPHYDYEHFHLWKDGVYKHPHFAPGAIKPFYDLAHEKLRTTLGPPVVQFCEANLLAAETLRGATDPYLRYQAELSARNAREALPIVRMVGDHAPSPTVKARVDELDALAARTLGRPSPLAWAKGQLVRAVAGWKARRLDPVERSPEVADPGVRWADYAGTSAAPAQRDPRREHARARLARKQVPPPVDPVPAPIARATVRLRVAGE